jgi:23S rRNA (uracil1939-C5)-methyltransferase
LLAVPPPEAGAALVPADRGGALEAVDVREVVPPATGVPQAMLTLVLARERVPGPEALRAAARAIRARVPALATVAVDRHRGGPQMLSGDVEVIEGDPELPDAIAPGVPWTFAVPGAFVQPHRGTMRALHERIMAAIRALGERPRVLELYAGSGALALRLAAAGAQVLAVDSFGPALERARRAADAQGITGLGIAIGDAGEIVAALASKASAERGELPFDAVILDPPRRGVPPALRMRLVQLSRQVIVYVSCDPETLARDLAHLARLGWAAREVIPFDMMPLGPHVEVLALLTRAPIPRARVLFEDEELVAVDKDPHEPTTPHPEHPSSLLARVRALSGCERAVPLHRLDAGTSGVCLFARAPEHVAALSETLARAKKRYLALVRGICHRKGIVRRPLRDEGKMWPAVTRYTRCEVIAGHSLVRAVPEQGRLHQVRRHLAAIGHPVLGDPRYGHAPSNRHLWERAALDRPFLHCERIELVRRGAPLVLASPLAPDLATVLERLRRREHLDERSE